MPSCNDLSEIGIEGVSPVVQKNFPLMSHSKFREFRISFCAAKFLARYLLDTMAGRLARIIKIEIK